MLVVRLGAVHSCAAKTLPFLHPISLITSITWSLHLGRLDTLGAARATLHNTTQSDHVPHGKSATHSEEGWVFKSAPASQRSQTPHLPTNPT